MKIRDLILSVLIAGMVISTGVLVVFASNGIGDVKNITSEASSGELLSNAGNSLQDLAISIRDSLDSQMQNQYEMVKTWAQEPSLIEVAKKAKSYSAEELFEMWSAKENRRYIYIEAAGDGNPNNDLSPAVSKYLTEISTSINYPEIFITDYRGYTIAANTATSVFGHGADLPRVVLYAGGPVFEKKESTGGGEDWYRAALASTEGFYVSDIIWDSNIKKWGIEIVSQLRDPATGEYLGQIKAHFDYGTFINQFLNAEIFNVYEIKVVDRRGLTVATSLGDKTKTNNVNFRIFDQLIIYNAVSAKEIGYIPEPFVDENDKEVYLGFAKSEDYYGHIVMVTKKAADVAAPIDTFVGTLQSDISEKSSALQRNMLIIGAVVAIAIILLAAFILRAKVSVPLAKLTAISDKLSKGEIEGLQIDIKGKDEISRFGEHFKGVLAAFEFLKDEAEKKQ